jgi:hypothetical protein
MFFPQKKKPSPLTDSRAESSYRTARLQSAQLALARLLKVESLGHNVIIERTIAEIEVSRLQARVPAVSFTGLKMIFAT